MLARVFGRPLSTSRGANRPRRRSRLLQLEGLEDRTVPTIVYKPVFGPETTSQPNGEAGSQPQVFLIFWGSFWNNPANAAQKTSLINAATGVVTSTFPLITNQYGANGSGMNIASTVTDNSDPVSGNFAEGGIDNVVQNQIDNGPLPESDALNGNDHHVIYVVVTPPTINSSYGGNVAGFNHVGTDTDFGWGVDVDDIGECWVSPTNPNTPNTPTVSVDAFSLTFSHEVGELMSDWDGEGYEVNPPPGAPPGSGNQIGDYEGNSYSFRLKNNVAVQPLWSRADNAFAVTDGTSQKFFLDGTAGWSGISPNQQFNGKFALTLQGDQLGSPTNDNVTITRGSNGGVQVTQNGETVNFDPGQITSITVNMQNGNDTINVEKTIAGVPVTINLGSGNDVVNISPSAHNLDNIQGNVTINSGQGSDSLNVYDQSNAGSHNFVFWYNAFKRQGAAWINYGNNFQSLTVNAGDGNNTFVVTSTQTGTNTTINTGNGPDTVFVDGTALAGTLTINGGTGKPTVNVLGTSEAVNINGHSHTNVVVGNSGNAQGVTGPLTLTNPPDYNTLTVDDSTDPGSPFVLMYTVSINGSPYGVIAGLTPGGIFYKYGDTDTVTVETGTGAGTTVDVATTGKPVNLISHGPTTVNVGGSSIQQVYYPLTITNVSALTTINANDFSDTWSTTTTLDTDPVNGFGRISNLAPGTIEYNYAETASVTVQTGTGGATVNVLATGAPVNLIGHSLGTVNVGNAGSVQQILAPLTITNPPSWNTINVDDSADPADRTVTLDTVTISGSTFGRITDLSQGAIEYKNGDTSAVNIYTGAGGAAVYAHSNVNPINLVGNSSSNSYLNASDAANIWVITGHDSGNLNSPNGNLTFSGIRNLWGGNGADTFLFYDGASVDGAINGGGGTNTLDYSGYSSSVIVDLQTGFATGVGGGVWNIQNVNGGTSRTAAGPGVYNLLIGNGGNVLTGGDGRRNLLIAGGSPSTLYGGNQDDILIGGSTSYDTQPGLTSLEAIMAYWSTTTDSYATRVNKLLWGNGVPALNALTVGDNGGGNTMMGHHGGAGELNLFYGKGPNWDTTDWNGFTETFIGC
jgi:hypothetical protein